MEREDMILTPEEEARNRSDTLLLLGSLRQLPREGKLYLAGIVDGMLQSRLLAPPSDAPATRPTA